MNAKRNPGKTVYPALLVLLGVLLLTNLHSLFAMNGAPKTPKGYFLSASTHSCASFTNEDHSCPADNEEDEDEDDDENEFESLITRPPQKLSYSISFTFHHDQLFSDPLKELVSPPPKR